MKIFITLTTLVFILLLTACDNTENEYILAADETTEEINSERECALTIDEPDKEVIEEIAQDSYIIDFIVVESIGSNMPPFAFRVIGEITDGYVKISEIIITDDTNTLIQRLDGLRAKISTQPFFPQNWVSKENNWGFSLRDYNFDGYLDMSLMMLEGGSSRNSPSYFWLWDAEIEQFVKNHQLMEMSSWSQIGANPRIQRIVTFSRSGMGNYYDGFYKYVDGEFVPTAMFARNWPYVRLEIIQQIHPNMPPFIFIAKGQDSTGFYTDINSITITNADGELIQQIDGLNTEFNRRFLERTPDGTDFALYFEDLNFDGYLDMILQRCDLESLSERPSYIWLWDAEVGKFVKNQQLITASEHGIMRVLERYQQVQFYHRVGHGTGREYYWYYEYADGEFDWVARREFRRDIEQGIWCVELDMRQRIHPDMPMFRFFVEGQEAASEFHGDLAIDLNSIRIYDDSWNLVQHIDGLNTQL